jgi:hypothetical protein
MMTFYFTGECDYITSLKGVKKVYHSVKRVMMTYFTEECDDITSLKSVKMEYHFREEGHDDVLLHWRV